MTTEQRATFYQQGVDDAANGTKDYFLYAQCAAYHRGWNYESHLQEVRRERSDETLIYMAS